MLSSNISYPYPLLRGANEDFETTVFSNKLEILREDKGFRIVPDFSVNNKQIISLIETGFFSYAVQIQCRSTYYRTVVYVNDNNPFLLPSEDVHEKVELTPCIIAKTDIDNYCVDDFVPAFKTFKIKIMKNDVVGIGTTVNFNAYYKADEVKKANSVITIKSNEKIDRVKVDLSESNIIVNLPADQYDAYMRAGTSTSDQVTLLTGIISVPVIAIALNEIDDDDESDYSENAWYKSLRAVLDRMAGGNQGKISALLEDTYSTAQMMLGENLATSLKILDDREW